MLFSTVITVIVIDFRTTCLPKKLKYNEIQHKRQDRTQDTMPRKGDGMRKNPAVEGIKRYEKPSHSCDFPLL